LALYSNPSYDPNELIGVISPEFWRELNVNPARPLLDRSVSGIYTPGSTFKLATAAIALELGVLDPAEHMPIPCRGGMRYTGRYFRCAEPSGHGFLNLPQAIQRSCNVYFYQVGLKVGLERFLEVGGRMGLARRTNIDFPIESASRFPSSPDWYRAQFGSGPVPSEILHLSIGQGPVSLTALQLAHLYTALAGDGYAPPPRIARVEGPLPEDEGLRLNLTPEQLAAAVRLVPEVMRSMAEDPE
jgi:penicillin-binding protein 2